MRRELRAEDFQSRAIGVGTIGQRDGVLIIWTSETPVIASVIVPLRSLSEALGVGHNPDAIPYVRGAKGGSR